jgi:ribosomal protein RSM22 (predicted rRNA methylase)
MKAIALLILVGVIILAILLTKVETFTDAKKEAACQMLFELLDPNGVIVFLESGNPLGSHTVRTARQFLLNMMKTMDNSGRFSNNSSPNASSGKAT